MVKINSVELQNSSLAFFIQYRFGYKVVKTSHLKRGLNEDNEVIVAYMPPCRYHPFPVEDASHLIHNISVL